MQYQDWPMGEANKSNKADRQIDIFLCLVRQLSIFAPRLHFLIISTAVLFISDLRHAHAFYNPLVKAAF